MLSRPIGWSPSLEEIGQTLHVSKNTVKTHQRAIYRKLGVGRRSDAVERARRYGLVGPDG
jgi:LuxR family maltose regulon positive regulatory protein